MYLQFTRRLRSSIVSGPQRSFINPPPGGAGFREHAGARIY